MKTKVDSQFTDEMQNDLFEIEDRSWWFQYRAKLLSILAGKYFRKQVVTYDIGGGNGYTTHYLQQEGYEMALVEPTVDACNNGRKRGLKRVICGTVDDLQEKVEQITCLDVLEHIEDDKAFLSSLNEHLNDKGHLLLTVPAFNILWSSEDDVAGHFRRYRVQEITALVENCGFEVLYASYFYQFLFLPILLIRVGLEKIGILKRADMRSVEEKRKISRQQFKKRGKLITAILDFLAVREQKIISTDSVINFGSSIVIMAEKVK